MVPGCRRLVVFLAVLALLLAAAPPEMAAGVEVAGRRGGRSGAGVEVELGGAARAPPPLSFVLDSKRRVPRGSDPIHNRC
ncbi:unnamed protein product [Spirodela intermedia]|uniref:Uncharacterized protein n=1 Tax=Spirodela intermedia TaxID=51605 RepID=A0A7I8KX62_SPIIN|nr:unnamed protein product [Spirodela intermedia]